MKKIALIALAAGLPLVAQSWELGLFAGQQSYKSISESGLTGEPKSKTVLAGRLGYSLVDVGPALFQVNLGFQPKVDTAFQVNGKDTPVNYQHQYMSVGAMFNFKAMVAFGVGLDYRMEKVNGTLSGIGDVSYNRPWLRATAGYAFPTPVVKPFIGLEVGVPLTSKSYDPNGSTEDAFKAMAPKLQIGLYGGIRF